MSRYEGLYRNQKLCLNTIIEKKIALLFLATY